MAVNSAVRLIFRILFQDDLQRFSQLKIVRVGLMQIHASHWQFAWGQIVQNVVMRWDKSCIGRLEKRWNNGEVEDIIRCKCWKRKVDHVEPAPSTGSIWPFETFAFLCTWTQVMRFLGISCHHQCLLLGWAHAELGTSPVLGEESEGPDWFHTCRVPRAAKVGLSCFSCNWLYNHICQWFDIFDLETELMP